jgi:hypothetical protein
MIRVLIEEKSLKETFGAQFEAYAEKAPVIIPLSRPQEPRAVTNARFRLDIITC